MLSRVNAARTLVATIIAASVGWVINDRIENAQDAALDRIKFEAFESNRRVNALFEAARVLLDALSEYVVVEPNLHISIDPRFDHSADRATSMRSMLAGAIVQDAEGRIVAAAQPRSGVGLLLGSLDYFQELKRSTEAVYAIGSPFRSEILGTTLIPLARAVRTPTDDLVAVIAVGIRLDHIQNALAPSIQTDDARSRLWRDDGLLLVSSADDNVEIGRHYPNLPLFTAKKAGPGGSFVAHSPLTGEIRLSAWRDSFVYPYFVSTGANRANIMRRDYLEAVAIGVAALFLLGFYLVTILLVDAERRKTNSALVEKTRALNVKTMFLANMSHEFRTPLNAISGYSQMLELGIYGPLGEKQKEAVGDMSIAVNHLASLTETLLDLSRIEAGKLPLELKQEPIARIVGEAVTLVAPISDLKGITVKADSIPSEIEAFIDRLRTRQILTNLLSNAIRSVGEGGVIEIRAKPATAGKIRLCVCDDGPGLGNISIESLFEPFNERDARTASKAGVGLGLPLSRALARAQGGDLTLASRPGRGAVAMLELPEAA